MAFPTICESDLIKNIMPLIRAGKNVETIVNEIQNPLFSVLTINMKSLSLGNAEHQKTLLSVILQLYPSAIIFCQEPPENFVYVVPSTACCTPVKDKATTAVVCAAEQFNTTELKETEGILEEILDTMKEDNKLRSRLSMVRLTTTAEPTKSTLAVSYHGPHVAKGLTNERKSALSLRLLRWLHKIKAEENDIDSFIVGGDFNLDTTELDMKELSDHVKVGRKEKNKEKSTSYKDNFFWSTESTIHNIKALKGSPKNSPFDHDPVVGELVFQPERRVEEHHNLKDSGKSVDSDEHKDSSPKR